MEGRREYIETSPSLFSYDAVPGILMSGTLSMLPGAG